MKRYIAATILLVILLIIFGSSCGNNPNRCEFVYYLPEQTDYSVDATELTPKNIAIDPSGQNISGSLVDRLTDETEACLIKNFGNPPILSEETQTDAICYGSSFILPIRRECLTVKVSNDWFLSTDGTQQLLPYIGGYGDCGKGLPGDGPCYWRAGVQNNLTIATTPSFYLYKDPLVKITTGCTYPWFDAKLAECMEPTTEPLSDGSSE